MVVSCIYVENGAVQNLLFSTVHQNVNKPKSRAIKTACGPLFLPFCVINISLFSLVKMQICQDQTVPKNLASF